MSTQERLKGKYKEHECENSACMCYECSICNKKLVHKGKFVKHQLFSDCKLKLTQDIKASDLARENRKRANNNNPDGDGGGEPLVVTDGGDGEDPGGQATPGLLDIFLLLHLFLLEPAQ